MYRIAQNLWLDLTRAKKPGSEVSDPDVVAALSRQDGCNMVEGRLTRDAVLEAMTEPSPEQQVLVALVGFAPSRRYLRTAATWWKASSHSTASPTRKPPKLPARRLARVMSRLARARRELHARLEPQIPMDRARRRICPSTHVLVQQKQRTQL
jgi:hypothetical protein